MPRSGPAPLVPGALALAALLLAGCAPESDASLSRFAYEEPHMGTAVRVVLWAPDRDRADSAAAAAFATAARLDSLFSDYRDDSEVAFLAAEAGSGALRVVSPELWAVLTTAADWAERTDGAFDVTVGPLTRLWRTAMREGTLPDSVALAEARAAAGIEGLVFDPATGAVGLRRPGMSLDLGGIAKGFAAGVMLDTLAGRGITAALVDAGGDLALGAAPSGEAGWSVEFPGGERHRLEKGAVATSGDRYQFLEVDGVRYSHILDPRTGLGIRQAPTVVVVAPDPTTADVLASALTVLDAERGRALVEGLPGVWVRVTSRDAGPEALIWETEGFPGLEGSQRSSASNPPGRP